MTTIPTLDDGTASAIRQAMAALARGQLLEARSVGEHALRTGGDPVALNAMLGTLCLRSGELDAAAGHLAIAHQGRPGDSTIAANLATALVEAGSFEDALDVASEARAAADPSYKLLRIRAFALQSTGDFAAAAKAYERLVSVAPQDWESWNNLGNSRLAAGDMEGAVEALRRAARDAPGAAPVRLNLTRALSEAGHVAEAESELRRMAQDFAGDPNPWRELHVLMRAQAREADALTAVEEASRRAPGDLALRLAVASQRLLLLDNEGAEEAYRDVIASDPQSAEANLGLAVTYELGNRTDDLSALADEAMARGANDDTVNFIRAFAFRRAKRFQEGIDALRNVPRDLEADRQAQLLGQLYDGAGDYAEAWRQFTRMKDIQRADPSQPEARASRYRQAIRDTLAITTREWAHDWSEVNAEPPPFTPVFLVGFPRSGTTLLDTILLGHPDVVVIEEEPTLERASMLLGDIRQLPEASRETVLRARKAYQEDIERIAGDVRGKVVIDKNPMTMIAIPLIYRMFPDAKIVLALRHPCDAVLSCFTTNFKLNDAMSNFVRLDTTAELYDLAFQQLEQVRELLPLRMHAVAYEDLVADREATLRPLFTFLDLPWTDELLDHQRAAANRGPVKTASYAQIVEPIYSRSSGRWLNYRDQLEPVVPVLKPWIEKFGYRDT